MDIGIICIVYIGIGVIISAFAAFMRMRETNKMSDDEFIEYVYDDEESRARILTIVEASTVRNIIELATPLVDCIAWPYVVYGLIKNIKND